MPVGPLPILKNLPSNPQLYTAMASFFHFILFQNFLKEFSTLAFSCEKELFSLFLKLLQVRLLPPSSDSGKSRQWPSCCKTDSHCSAPSFLYIPAALDTVDHSLPWGVSSFDVQDCSFLVLLQLHWLLLLDLFFFMIHFIFSIFECWRTPVFNLQLFTIHTCSLAELTSPTFNREYPDNPKCILQSRTSLQCHSRIQFPFRLYTWISN